ncbi:hypothetical protein [Terriglobus sp.]|uniref:hypothetical protein n=1 Tax=Terriglobus sp. TaxID=1889013 RepID=UPI003AFFE44C
MKRLFFWLTLASGVTAAILMARRGESFGSITKKAINNPFGALGNELKTALAPETQTTALQS